MIDSVDWAGLFRDTQMSMSSPAFHEDGRIPFRVRIGVTGHRTFAAEESALAAVVRQQLRRVIDLLDGGKTTVCLSAVSQLADGADRLVAREVLAEASERGQEARLEIFLPMGRQEYVEVQEFDPASVVEFNRFMKMAAVRREPVGAHGDTAEGEAAAYAAAGHLVVGRSDVLIALWDGKHPAGPGGTAEALIYAAARSKPCIWIQTHCEPVVRDNLAPGGAEPFFREVTARAALGRPVEWGPMDHPREAMRPLLSAFRTLDEFNRESLAADYDLLLRKELASREGVAPWVAAPFIRATSLAARWRSRFQRTAWLITAFAAIAAAMLAVGLSYGEEEPGWAWAEAGFFALALFGLVAVRRVGFHRRWLSDRVLAERLRSAHFLAPTGADFRRQARLEPVYAGSESTGWLMRALEEVWDRRPQHPPPLSTLDEDELRRFKEWLADDWIGEQIKYHERAERHHRRWHLALTGSVVFLFAATIVFACLHSMHLAENAAVFFSIALPAVGASIGVLLTVNQHQALSERSARMHSDLAVVRRNILDATSESLDGVSSEAARTIAQETGAWFGSMWFLDIEHP